MCLGFLTAALLGFLTGFTSSAAPLCVAGMRKDRGRVMRRDRQRTASSDRDKVPRVLERRTAPPQDKRRHSGGGAGRGGKATPVISMSPEQVWRPCVSTMSLFRMIHKKWQQLCFFSLVLLCRTADSTGSPPASRC